jgi:hypothetical protein
VGDRPDGVGVLRQGVAAPLRQGRLGVAQGLRRPLGVHRAARALERGAEPFHVDVDVGSGAQQVATGHRLDQGEITEPAARPVHQDVEVGLRGSRLPGRPQHLDERIARHEGPAPDRQKPQQQPRLPAAER